jgi:hypothetical protein
MTEATQSQKPAKDEGSKDIEKDAPINKLTLAQVDAGLAECDKIIKDRSETVKTKLAANAALPPTALRELSRANFKRGKLMLRRFALLLESGDQAALDQIDKLMKLKVTKAA